MKYEREGLLLPEPNQKQLDQKVFESFESIRAGMRATYEDLSPSDEKKQKAIELWPLGQDADLSVDKLDASALFAKQQELKDWKKKLIDDETVNPEIKQLYRWRINEDIASINMLIASRADDMRSFRFWNKFIYGRPDENIYKAALDWVAVDAEKIISTDGQKPNAIKAAQDVIDMLDGKRGNLDLLVPDKNVFEIVKVDHKRALGYYSLLLAGVTIPEGKVTNAEGDPIIEYVLKNNLKSDYKIAEASGTSWSVSHKDQSIERPDKYNLPPKRFVGLGLGHEIGSHLLEKVNGKRGPLALASSGLDRYELGNEGRAVIREQVVYETFDEFGKQVRWRDIMRRHIAISYACGVGEDKPKRSSEVYEFMNKIDTMYQMKLSPDEPDVVKEKASKKTTDLLLRVLKGTDGAGGAYLKDKVYLEGVVANWLTAAQKGPSAISEGDLGKFDINNPRHITALQKMNLLPNNE